MQTFDKNLEKYADLIINYGLNLQEDQCLRIIGEPEHRLLIIRVTQKAYEVGVKFVDVQLSDRRISQARVDNSKEEHLDFIPDYINKRSQEMKKKKWANLQIVGSNFPDALEDSDPAKINRISQAKREAVEPFDQQRMEGKVQWTIAPAATAGWARKIFPNLKEKEAVERLWSHLFEVTMTSKNDPVSAWEKHDRELAERLKELNSKPIEWLHFKDEGTDLRIGLPEEFIFEGGRWQTPEGQKFEPNIPTYEVFTAPDRRKTEGKVRITKPCKLRGQLVEDLKLEFKNGKLKDFSAEKGEDAFREFIETEKGADKLGEVALVGADSPIFKSGLVFENTLLDENSACHIAFGQAYKACIEDGKNKDEEDLENIGFNHSPKVHQDFMISTENTQVTAILENGEKFKIMKEGSWII